MRSVLVFVPPVAALLYPAALAGLYHAAAAVRTAADAAGAVAGAVGLAAAVAAVLAPTAGGVLVAHRLGRDGCGSLPRWLTHLAVATPPLFTTVSVVLIVSGLGGGDLVVWSALWVGVLVWLAVASRRPDDQAPGAAAPVKRTPLRVAHGAAAAVLLLAFLLPHLLNHTAAGWSVDAHRAVMAALRTAYRHPAAEPVLVALFGFQLASGGRLLAPRLGRPTRDAFDTLLTASGGYLGVFIVSHTTAVLVLGRWLRGVDTDWAFATGGAHGLLGDVWHVRLIPYYTLGVFALLAHAAVGLRVVLLAHAADRRTANAVAVAGIAAGAVLAGLVTAAMLGLRLAPDAHP